MKEEKKRKKLKIKNEKNIIILLKNNLSKEQLQTNITKKN